MSMMSPDPDDILRDLESQFEGMVEPSTDTLDITSLHDADLNSLFNQTREALIELGEMHHDPRTQEGRELHSIRLACLVELKKRGWR